MLAMSPVRTIYPSPGFQPWVGFAQGKMRAVGTPQLLRYCVLTGLFNY